jgi:hypothetical protein
MMFKPQSLLLFLCLHACAQQEMRTAVTAGPPISGVQYNAELSHRNLLDHPDALGISGSCMNHGEVWLVGERNARLLRVSKDNQLTSIPIEGLPEGLDMEGLACKDGRFYLSTESQDSDRDSDVVLIVEVQGATAMVIETLVMQYPDGLKAGVNQGLEGLCIAGDWLVAAAEIVRTDSSGRRQAPFLRQRLGDSSAFLHWVNLTTSSGKISGIDCRLRGDAIEVFAIERHYEVSRILHFELGDGPSQSDTILELAHLVRESENFESIVVDDRGEIRLSNDNQYKTITGPTEETVLEIVPAFALESGVF